MKKNTLQNFVRRNGYTLFLLVTFALLAPARLWGQETQTLTVHNGTTTNGYVPVYGYYADAYLKAEFVMPAAELSEMAGGEITAMKFYATQSGVGWGNAYFQVFLTEVDGTTISSYHGPGTVVFEGYLTIVSNTMTVTFSTPYQYNGGNLLIGVYNTVKGTYVTSTWYGETVNGASIQGYSYDGLSGISAGQRNFLPKTTFTYEFNTPKPQALTISNITAHGATLSWTAPNEDVIGYAYQYQPAGGEWTTLESTTETSVTLSGLTSDTDYSFQVKALYPDNVESNFTTTTFQTLVSCPKPVDLQATLTQGDATVATLSWTESGEATTWILEYSENANFTGAIAMTVNNTPSCSIINLTPETKYYARVKADCGGGDQSQWSNTLTFRPTNCSIVTIGTETNPTYMCPVTMGYNYSITQQIYTAEEIGTEGTIYSISFYYDYTEPFAMDGIRLFLKSVSRSAFGNVTDREILTSDDLAWTGTFSATEAGWVTIDLDDPFDYDGSSNLLVCVCDNTSGKLNNSYVFCRTSCSEYKSYCYFSDNTSPDPYSTTSYSGSTYQYHNNIQVGILPPTYPRPMNLQATLDPTDATVATLNWTEKGTATSWVLEYGTSADFTGATSVTVNGTPTYNLTGLTPEVRYYARVKAVNGDNQSQWSKPVDFRPTNCNVVGIGDETSPNATYCLPVTMSLNYSLTQQIYTAQEVGMEGTIYSISFYYTSYSSFSLSNIKMYMKNVTRSLFSTSTYEKEPLTADNLVWTGTLSASNAGWVTIDLDTPFAYDGTSNLLVAVYDDNNGKLNINYKFRESSCSGNMSLFWYHDDYIPDLSSNSYNGSHSTAQSRNNIKLEILPPSCPRPTNPQATLTEGDATVASVSWTEIGSATNWVLQYGTDNTFAAGTYIEKTTDFTINGTTITANLTNLTPEQSLYARVKADCGGGDESLWSPIIEFRPTACDIVTIGDETLSSSSCVIPVHMQYNFSLSQQIFTAEEIGTEGMIYTISFYYVASSSYPLSMNNVRVYMKNVTRDVFANDPDMEPLTSNDQVWRGTLSASGPGWVTLTLDTPFAYDGVSNLLVAVWDPVTGKLTNNYGFRTNSCTEKMAICWYYDSNGPQLSDLISGYSGYKNRYSYRNVIQLGILPASCSRPADLQATLTEGNASIATLSWTENGEATNWVLEYSTAADFSDATSVNVSGTPSLDLSDLASETRYYARVKADCGSSQSEWSKTIEFRPTNCTHVAIGEGTESYISLPLCMQHDYSRAQQIFTAEEIGTEGMIYSISFYYQGLSPFSWNNIKMSMKHVTRSVFTDRWTMEPMSEDDVVWTGTFKASEPGWVTLTLDTPFAYDGASNLLVQLFDGYSGGALGVNYTFRSSIYSDYQSIFWGNSYSVEQYASYGSGYNSMGYSKTRNDIIIDILPAPCQRPTNLHASLSVFSPTTASVSWREKGEATSWVLQYSTNNEFATYTEVTQGISVDGDTITAILTDLTPETTYYVRVKADCGSEQSQWSPTMEFMPTAYITIGDETNSNYALPISASAEYSFSQQIYTAEEIAAAGGGAGTITSVGFYYQGYTTAYTLEGIQVYMINTNKTNFSSYYDAVDLSLENKVYEGPLPLPTEGGWVTLTLDNEFDYDGTNILICVIDPTEGHLSGIDCQFYSSYSSEYKAINNSNNDVAYEYNNLSSIGINQNNYRNNIRFLPTFYPKPRYLTVSNITPHTADLSWAPHDSSVTGYQYQYKVGEGEWSTLESTTNTSLTLTELTPEGEYTFRVQALYGENAGDFNSIDFTVLATCPKPTDLQYALTLGDGTVATLTWEQGYFEEAWVLQYGTDSEFTEGSYTEMTTGFTVDGTSISVNLTGLTPEVTCYARVKADCGDGDQSYWTQTEFIPTDVIPLPVVNGTDCNEYVPLNCRYAQNGTRSQFIIPHNRLFEVVDGMITGLTFYPETHTAFDLYDDSFKIYLAEVDFTAFTTAEYYNWEDMTQVYDGHLSCDGHQMTITFDTPYYYNGGDLLIGFYEYEYGNAYTSYYYWLAEYQDANCCVYNYAINFPDSYTATIYTSQYLPSTTVHYVARAITDTPRPKYLTANCVLARTATMNWVAPADDVISFQWRYKADGAEEWVVGSTTDTVVNLTDLTVVTHYTFQVKALYPDEAESEYATVSFNTHNLCDVPTDLTATLVPYNGSMAIISWTENGEATSWVLQYDTENVFTSEETVEITEGFEVVDGNHVSCVLTGLTESVYFVRVRPACSEDLWTTTHCSFQPTYASFSFNSNDNYQYYNQLVPVYGNYSDCGTMSQFIIPSAMLSDLAGGEIHRMRFRSTYQYNISNSTFGDAEFEVYMKEVDNTSFDSYYLSDWADWENLDDVYHGTLAIRMKQMWVDLDEGFNYQGDNLLIGFKQITPGTTNASVYWVGKGNGDLHSSVFAYKTNASSTTYNNAGYGTNYSDGGPFLPEIIFKYIPTEYPRIDTVMTVDLTATTAQFAWEAPNDLVTGYAYQYKRRNNEWPENWIETNDTEATIQNLRQASQYRFRVKALYGEHESAPFTVDILTECDTYADVPFTENFDSYFSDAGEVPYCWSFITSNGYPKITSDYSRSGRNKLYFYSYSSYSDEYAILPQVQNVNEYRIKFYARVNSTSYPSDIVVGVMTDPTDVNSFTPIETVDILSDSYQKFKVSFENYTGGDGFIALKMATPSSSQYKYVYMDDVTVEPIPSCEEPEILEILNITGHTATLRWTNDGAGTWQLYAATENVMPADTIAGQEVTTNPGTITELEAETPYYVWVRSLCGDGTYSPWSDAYTFTTEVACPIPVNLEVTNVTGHTATLNWTDLYGDPTEWMICLYEGETEQLFTADSVPYTISGLNPETDYYVKVNAWCGENDGYSVWSSTVYFHTTVSCFPVTNLHTTEVGAATATLAWGTNPQQEAGNAPSVWNVEYLTAPAVTYDFESPSGIPEYYTNNETDWAIVNADTIASLTAHSGTHCLISNNDEDETYIYIPAYGGAAASFWAKSLVENDTVFITIYYDGYYNSGGGDEPGMKGRNGRKGRNVRENRDEYMGSYYVTSDTYKKITVDLADYLGDGSLTLRVSGQMALDDVTVNMPATTVTQETLDFNQGSIGNYAQYWDGWSLVIDGDDGYIMSEANYEGAYVGFPIQLGSQISFRAKALVDENDTIQYYLAVGNSNVGLIARDSIMVTDTFENYTWDLSQYSGTAYLEFYAEYQPSLVVDDLSIPSVEMYTALTVNGEPTLQMTNLQQLAVYEVYVQAHCGEEDESSWEWTSFVPALCESENQCIITYEWSTEGSGYGYDAYLKIVHHESGLRAGATNMDIGTSGSNTLSLCDGEAYDVYYISGGKDSHVDFTIYDAAGDVITNYAQFMSLPEGQEYFTFTMDCDVCQWPQHLTATNLTTESALLTWEQGGDVTSWLVSYRETESDSLVLALNESNWTARPQGWTSLTFDNDYNLVAFEDWTPVDGALVSDTMSFLFIPVTLGGQAVITASGSENEFFGIGVYQGNSLVGLNSDNIPYPSGYYLSESAQSYTMDLSEYQGNGYLFLYHECGDEPANLYLDSFEVYELAWSEGVIVDNTPSYTLTGLTAGTSYQARVQAVCGNDEYSNPAKVSFTTPFCDPESQCEVSYVLRDSYGDSWENAYVSVVHQNSNTEVARLTMQSNDGYELMGTLALCDGETYDFNYVTGGCCVSEHRFAIFDPSGEVVMDYLNVMPDVTDVISYTMDCGPTIIQFTEGWNWWAPTVETNVLELEDLDELESILSQNGPLTGNLDLVAGQMYKVLVSDDCIMSLDGEPFTTATVNIAQGYNWFGFIGVETTVTDAFADFGPEAGDKVISQNDGFAIYTVVNEVGSWQGTLTTLVPGKGYVYVSQDTESKTLNLGGQ